MSEIALPHLEVNSRGDNGDHGKVTVEIVTYASTRTIELLFLRVGVSNARTWYLSSSWKR